MLTDVREQDEGVRFLRRMIEGHLTFPLLLVGNEGVGKRFSAIQAVKEWFCAGTRANDCPCLSCVQINAGVHPDLSLITPEADKDIGVEVIREITEGSQVYPIMGACRVFVVDGADRLTVPAANAFLKTLEEPPHTARFLLLASSKTRVIPTIRSRCGLVSYHPLSEAFVLSSISKFVSDETKALVYARLGEGSIGRALGYWGSGRLLLRDKTFALIQKALDKDFAGFFVLTESLEKELPQVLSFLIQLIHDFILVSFDSQRILNVDLLEQIEQVSVRTGKDVWHQLLSSLRTLREQSRRTKLHLPFHIKAIFAQALMV